MEVLDKNGLEHFWGNAKEYVDSNKTTSYSPLTDKPKINNVELSGNKTLTDIGVQQTVISETEPVDNSVQVWINPSGNSVTIPTKTSDLINDSGFITSESDPTVPSHVKGITQENINSWNGKSNFSGNYNDLSNKPTIPTATSDLTNDSDFATEGWVNQQISTIQPSGSSAYETVANNTINNGTTQSINIDFDNSYNELIVYIDFGGNNKQLGSAFWKINNINANSTSMSTYRYYHAQYTVTPLFTMFDVSSSNNNQVGYNVVRGQSGNINKISSFSVALSGDLYFPNGTKVQILGR